MVYKVKTAQGHTLPWQIMTSIAVLPSCPRRTKTAHINRQSSIIERSRLSSSAASGHVMRATACRQSENTLEEHTLPYLGTMCHKMHGLQLVCRGCCADKG